MKQFKYFETSFITLRDALRAFLKANNIYYELSNCFNRYHFSILVDANTETLINNFLDQESITEM